MTDSSILIHGRTLSDWQKAFPVIKDAVSLKETAWVNPLLLPFERAASGCSLTLYDVLDADERLRRFAPCISRAFPETAASGGIIESGLHEAVNMKAAMEAASGIRIPGRLLLKTDSHLPVSGSIKARGGIYEVLKTAEDIALGHGMLKGADDYSMFLDPGMRELLSGYSISVGSTGNLGLSIGIMSAALGFNVTVHMSHDARKWKKDRLRNLGVNVIEYQSDYSYAVECARRKSLDDPCCHFVDDENSRTLFLGYSTAALRLKVQLENSGITVDHEHPLLVYLPCGVGGGPGGVAFGLKMIYGDNVHCFFAEPTHSCCMLIGMATGLHGDISVGEFGIDNKTIADGLAVGKASGFVGKLMEPFISGCYTISDDRMSYFLKLLADTEGIAAEPSALAGMYGPLLMGGNRYREYTKAAELSEYIENSTQLVWLTGGSMVPMEEMEAYRLKGREVMEAGSISWR